MSKLFCNSGLYEFSRNIRNVMYVLAVKAMAFPKALGHGNGLGLAMALALAVALSLALVLAIAIWPWPWPLP